MPFLRTPCLSDSATPSMAARQAFLSFISQRLLKLISTELLMSSNHLILCHPLLLLPSLFPASGSFLMSLLFTSGSHNIGASVQHQSFHEYSGLISFRTDWFHLLVVQGTLKSLHQYHSSKASVLQCSVFFMIQLSHPYMTTRKAIALYRPLSAK